MNRHQHLSILYDIYCLMLFGYCIRLSAPFCSFPFAARARSAFGALKLAVLWLRCSATFAKRRRNRVQPRKKRLFATLTLPWPVLASRNFGNV